MKSALILIDLQNDFFRSNGTLGDKHLDSSVLLAPILGLTRAARLAHVPIFWVYSHYTDNKKETPPPPKYTQRPHGEKYADVPLNNEILSGTHTGRRACCLPETEGAAFFPDFRESPFCEDDYTIRKTYYSALTDTQLHETLQSLNIDRVYLAGVIANKCVQATCVDAFFHDYNVSVIHDAVSAQKSSTYVRALTEMERYYARLINTNTTLREWNIRRPFKVSLTNAFATGDCYVVFNFIDIEYQDDSHQQEENQNKINPSSNLQKTDKEQFQTFNLLNNEIEWCHDMEHKGGSVPRLVSVQGTLEKEKVDNSDSSRNFSSETNPTPSQDTWEPLYRHPAEKLPPVDPWTSTANCIRKEIENLFPEQKANHALIQQYRSGNDYIGEHSDKSLDISRGTTILNASFGASRRMILRGKKKGSYQGVKHTVYLPSNTVFGLGWNSNQYFYHEIRPDRRPPNEKFNDENGPRISLTIRHVATFQRRSDGMLKGQGAPDYSKFQDEDGYFDPLRFPSPQTEAEKLLHAYHDENKLSDTFDWDRAYGEGFHISGLPARPTLYWANGSVPSMKVQMLLGAIGMDFSSYRLRVMSNPKDTRRDFFLGLNPRGQTPFFIDVDGTRVNESLAILHYLDRKHSLGLVPNNDKMADVLCRAHEADNLLKAYAPLERLFKISENDEAECVAIRDTVQNALKMVEKELNYWELLRKRVLRQLKINELNDPSGSNYNENNNENNEMENLDENHKIDENNTIQQNEEPTIIGIVGTKGLSLADYCIFPVLQYIIHRGFDLQENYPLIHDYYNSMCNTKSARAGTPVGWGQKQKGKINIFERAKRITK